VDQGLFVVIEPLTPAQRRVMVAICAHVQRRHEVPSVREIMAATGIGYTNGVADTLVRLERKGYIKREGKGRFAKSRGLTILFSVVEERRQA